MRLPAVVILHVQAGLSQHSGDDELKPLTGVETQWELGSDA